MAPAGAQDDDPEPQGPSGASRQGIQSVEIAMTVLDALERGGGPMSLTQIAHASGMGASKAHRYLVSLGRAGMVAQSRSSGLYDMGPALRRLGAESLRRMDEVGLVSQYIPGLRDRTGHAVNLAVWGDHGPVIVRWDYGAYALPITVRVGATMPMLTSSVGRVYLAHLPRSLTEPVLRAQEADTRRRLHARGRRRRRGGPARSATPGPRAASSPASPRWPRRCSPPATPSRSSSPWPCPSARRRRTSCAT